MNLSSVTGLIIWGAKGIERTTTGDVGYIEDGRSDDREHLRVVRRHD